MAPRKHRHASGVETAGRYAPLAGQKFQGSARVLACCRLATSPAASGWSGLDFSAGALSGTKSLVRSLDRWSPVVSLAFDQACTARSAYAITTHTGASMSFQDITELEECLASNCLTTRDLYGVWEQRLPVADPAAAKKKRTRRRRAPDRLAA